MSEKLQAYLK